MKSNLLSQKTVFSLLACIGVAVLLSSCATEGQRLMSEGASPAYGQGFDDGCSSGKKSAGDMFSQFHKNMQLFQYDQDYRQGWNDGHEECRDEWLSMNRQQRLGIEQQRAADEHSLIEHMNDTYDQQYYDQQYLPQLSPEEVEALNRLGN